jgi:isoleucyl-tRNA synthetase
LSNWYVRRSRRRFWKSESDDDKLAAHTTLYTCLVTVCKLLAPIAPFIPEEIYRNLVCSVDKSAPESIHLTDYPVADMTLVDTTLNETMELVMDLASLGRAARASAAIKVRQPLAKAIVQVTAESTRQAVAALSEHLKEELNVKDVDFVDVLADDEPGCSVAGDDRNKVGVVTALSDDLIAEGLARELVRRLQMMRRSAGLEISDHIEVFYEGADVFKNVFVAFDTYIAQETLAKALSNAAPPEDAFTQNLKLYGSEVALGLRRVL